MLKVFQSNSFENPITVSSVFRKEKGRAALGKRKREYSLVRTPPFSFLNLVKQTHQGRKEFLGSWRFNREKKKI